MHHTDLRYWDKDIISPSTLILAAIKGQLSKIYPDVPQSPEVSTEIKLKYECKGMFHSTGEVVFIHSDQVIKTCPRTFISAFSKGLLLGYIRGDIKSIYPELATLTHGCLKVHGGVPWFYVFLLILYIQGSIAYSLENI